jgi:hypothetical protein
MFCLPQLTLTQWMRFAAVPFRMIYAWPWPWDMEAWQDAYSRLQDSVVQQILQEAASVVDMKEGNERKNMAMCLLSKVELLQSAVKRTPVAVP